ncbi:MAG TPA: cation:proton antiporter [Sulfuriferula sp.]|nr:cation:proton antiporter [Sulfuriferula sp.]
MNLFPTLALLTAAVLLVPLFRRAGLGSVLGYLVAGVVIGPYGLRFIGDPDAVLRIAELGVTLLMFLIGLELQPRRLWALKREVFGLGLLQVGSVAAVAGLIAHLLELSVLAAAVVGVALAMSSTAYILPLLAERRELTSRVGRESFSILLFQDVSVIPILVLLALLGAGNAAPPGWPALVALLMLALAGRTVLRWVFSYVARFAGQSGRELFTAAALLAAVGIAAGLEALHLSASLGAFLAGVLLADSEFRHELEASIEPFETLLLGLFFMAVGMGIDLQLAAHVPWQVLGLGLGILLLKGLVLYIARRGVGAPDELARPLSVMLATGGEFAFVLFGVAVSAQLLAPQQGALLTLGVAVSMALAPFLLKAHDRLERSLAARHAPPYSTIDDPGKSVVIAGFGRVGQVVGRMLNARNIEYTALDISPEQVDFVRQFGNKVYYGDAGKLSLLNAAKVENARLFVLAVDDVEASMRIAQLMRRHYPQVPILARARNRNHYMRLRELEIDMVERETWGSSVEMGKLALRSLDPTQNVDRLAELFVRHDKALLERQQAVLNDQPALIQVSKNARAELADIMQSDAEEGVGLDRDSH